VLVSFDLSSLSSLCGLSLLAGVSLIDLGGVGVLWGSSSVSFSSVSLRCWPCWSLLGSLVLLTSLACVGLSLRSGLMCASVEGGSVLDGELTFLD
jgi:hypothetical protein